MVSYIFGGNTNETPETIARKREIANALLRNSNPRNVGEGISALGDGIVAAVLNGRANAAENKGMETASLDFAPLLSDVGSTPDPKSLGSPTTTASNVGGAPNNDVYGSFMDTVKTGVTNPYGLAAVASTGRAESGFSPDNVNKTWSDPSQSGNPGMAGGVMSWRGDRLKAMQDYAAMAGERPGAISPSTQAKFFLQENPELIAKLNSAKSIEEAQSAINNAWKFAGYDQPSQEAARRLAYANEYLPKLTSNSLNESAGDVSNGWLSYTNQGATRNKPLDPKLVASLGFLPEMGVSMEVFSGGQSSAGEGGPRTGSNRHDHGNAADVKFYKDGRMLDWANPNDRPIFEEIVRRGKANGITGFGAGQGYMQPGSMHIGFGNEAVWGAGGKSANAPDWLRTAYYGNPSSNGSSSLDAANAMGAQPVPEAPSTVTAYNPAVANALMSPSTSPMTGNQPVRSPVEVAQASTRRGGIMDALMGGTPVSGPGTDYFPAAPNAAGQSGPSRQQIIRALTNPFASPEQRAIAQEEYQRMRQQQDPAYQLEQEYKRAQLEALRAKPAVNPVTVNGRLVNPTTGEVIADFSKADKEWQKLSDDTLYNPITGETKRVGGSEAKGFRFGGTSVEAQALNGLMDSGQLTPEQAQQLGAGKTITDPSTGAMILLTPKGLFGQPANGGPPQPLMRTQAPQAPQDGIDIFADTPQPSPAVSAPQAATVPAASGEQTVVAPPGQVRPGQIQLTPGKAQLPTETQRNRVASVDQAFKTITGELDRYADLVGKSGIEVAPGEAKDNLNTVRQGIMLQMKELFNLGVLNGPDLSLMERMIYDPVVDIGKEGGISNLPDQIMTAVSGNAGERAKNSVNELKRMLENIRSSVSGDAKGPTPEVQTDEGWTEIAPGVRVRKVN